MLKNIFSLVLLVEVFFITTSAAFKYQDIFADSFNQTDGKVGSLLSKWDLVLDAKHTNQQLNQYDKDDVYIKYGYMYVRAQQRQVKGFNFTSGRVNLLKKVSFLYGDVEVRVRAARGRGLASVISLTSGKWPPEIQFNVNGDYSNRIAAVLHYVENGKIRQEVSYHTSGDFTNEFRVLRVSWDPNEIVWSVDGQVVFRVTDQNKIPSDQLGLELLLDVGGNYLDVGVPDAQHTRFPAYLAVDSVSISQWK